MTATRNIDEANPSKSVENTSQHIAHIVQRSGTSFYWAMRTLEPTRRQDLFAIYAFCRCVDDIADGPDDVVVKRRGLADWRSEVLDVYQGSASTSIGQALSGVITRYPLSQNDFMAVIDGMESDAVDRVRITDQTALSVYIDQVACAVGRLCTPVFGLPAEQGRALAASLGEALQLTNILRDLEEDAHRDRLYLPLDMLSAHGINDGNASEVLAHPACTPVCLDMAQRAQSRFVEAAAILSQSDHRARRAPRLMMMAYRRLLEKIMRAGWTIPRRRVVLSPWEKIWIVVRYGWL